MNQSGSKLDARMVRTQLALRTAMLALIGRKTLDSITIRDIVAEAGIGYATFFRHYPSKGALLEEIVADEIAQLIGMSLTVMNSSGTLAGSQALFRHVDGNRKLWQALLTGGAAGTIREQFAKAATESGTRRINNDTGVPTELAVLFGVTATVEIIAWWLRQGTAMPVEEIAGIHDRLVVRPSLAPAR